jgi:N-acetylneuraminate lyase
VYAAGVHGVYVCGSTGEGMLQPVAERKRVAEAVLGYSPRDKAVIVHVGAACLADAVELGAHAAQRGAAAISSLPPAGPYSFAEVKSYYEALAGSCDAPLLIYFFPGASAAVSTTMQLLELCALPGVVGLKFTDHNLYKLFELKQSGVTVYSGYDEVLSAGLLMGADGGIGTFYNLVPELFVGLYRAARAGEWEQARALQQQINQLIGITMRFPLFAAVKQMLAWSGIGCGEMLPPRRNLGETEAAQLREALEEARLYGNFKPDEHPPNTRLLGLG